jgi:hypothetical protein
LTDSSIIHHDESTVTFRYRDNDTGKSRRQSLPVFAFLHRFLQHVLPKGFVKVRYYGLHHPHNREKLTLARAALYLHLNRPIPPPPPPAPEKPRPLCKACKTALVPGQMFKSSQLPQSHAPP